MSIRMAVEWENDVIDGIAATVRDVLQEKREQVFGEYRTLQEVNEDLTLKLKATVSGLVNPQIGVALSWTKKAARVRVIERDQLMMDLPSDGEKEQQDGKSATPAPKGPQVELEDRPPEEMVERAAGIVRDTGRASAGALQRRLKVSGAMATRLLGMLELRGLVTKTAEGWEPKEGG